MATGKVHTSDVTRPFKQDLPPKGGYAPINFKRIPARQIVNAKILFGGFAILQAYGIYRFNCGRRTIRRETIEENSALLSLEPLLAAERDRAFLKQLRKHREYEAELMKDVPGWEVGTWFGQPVYHHADWMDVSKQEFLQFARPIEGRREFMYREWLLG